MKHTAIAAAGMSAMILTLTLAGCSTNGTPTAALTSKASTPKVDTNRQACIDFGTVTGKAADLIVDGSDTIGQTAWQQGLDDLSNEFDLAQVQAHGDIADRMNDTVEDLPEPINSIMSSNDTYVSDVKRVYNACHAAGFPTNNFVTVQH